MIREALQHLADTARAAAAVQIVHPNAEPPHVYYLYDPNSKQLTRHEAGEYPPRRYTLGGIDAVAAAAKQWGTERAVILAGDGQVELLPDEASRRDAMICRLEQTPAYETLAELASDRKSYAQRDFIELLRIDLAEAVDAGAAELFRNVQLADNRQTLTSEQAAAKGLSRSVQLEMITKYPIPEWLTATVSVYTGFSHPCAIRCAVRIDLEAGKFGIVPTPYDIEAAQQATDAALVTELRRRLDAEGLSYPVIQAHR